MRTIAVMNQKGGVGKTTTALGLTGAITNMGGRVLLIDMDPQSNASSTLLKDYEAAAATLNTINDLMEADVEPSDVPDAITRSDWPGVDVIISVEALANREIEGSIGMEVRLQGLMGGIPDVYDAVIIDCPPSVGRLTVNSLLASNECLLVAEADNYSMMALNRMNDTLEVVVRRFKHDIEILGLAVNKVEPWTVTGRDMLNRLSRQYGEKLVAQIPKRVVAAAAAAASTSVFTMDSQDAKALQWVYTDLAKRVRFSHETMRSTSGGRLSA